MSLCACVCVCVVCVHKCASVRGKQTQANRQPLSTPVMPDFACWLGWAQRCREGRRTISSIDEGVSGREGCAHGQAERGRESGCCLGPGTQLFLARQQRPGFSGLRLERDLPCPFAARGLRPVGLGSGGPGARFPSKALPAQLFKAVGPASRQGANLSTRLRSKFLRFLRPT